MRSRSCTYALAPSGPCQPRAASDEALHHRAAGLRCHQDIEISDGVFHAAITAGDHRLLDTAHVLEVVEQRLAIAERALGEALESDAFLNGQPYNPAFAKTMTMVKDFWNIPAYGPLLAASQKWIHKFVVENVAADYHALHRLPTTPLAGTRYYSGAWAATYVPDETKAADSRDDSFSLICPAKLGFCILTDSRKLMRCQTSSGASLTPRGTRLRNSQNSRTASA